MAKYNPIPSVKLENRQWPSRTITRAPQWVSVDLRDGNQALATPMNITEKTEMFELLLSLGFKQIEVGFPSASQIEFDFLRKLVDEKRVPDDVSVQVLCQAREHLVEKTFEALVGVKKAIFHIYSSTSPAHRKYTFNMDKTQIKNIAIDGIKMIQQAMKKYPDIHIQLQYSPESFSSTEMDFALEVCEAVMQTWQPANDNPIIFNLPATVECCLPNVHADQVEYFATHISDPSKVIISVHTHNDQGTGLAAAELAVLAGAQRVEGTLFGNGERTGNLDIIAMALNLYSMGIDPAIDVYNVPMLAEKFEKYTGMTIPPRQPYAGELVFTAFSGSHQDAIKKALDARAINGDDNSPWEVPYLPIDPKDIHRSYEAIIRINSQSGKGGVAYILQNEYNLALPKAMHPEIGKIINETADSRGVELKSEEIYSIFKDLYINLLEPLELKEFRIVSSSGNHELDCEISIIYKGKKSVVKGKGKGPIDAFVHGISSLNLKKFSINDFHEHAIGTGSEAKAASYVEITSENGQKFWGAGIDPNITLAGLFALVSAINRAQ